MLLFVENLIVRAPRSYQISWKLVSWSKIEMKKRHMEEWLNRRPALFSLNLKAGKKLQLSNTVKHSKFWVCDGNENLGGYHLRY
jgi:hypothetical protein